MAENFEIVPRHDDAPAAKETKPNMLSLLESISDGFAKVIAAFIGGVGQAIAGVALGTAKFVGHIVDAAKEIAGGIAKAIKGEGASMKVISGAVDERLGPLDTAITEAGEKFSEISDKIDDSIREQDRLNEEMVKNDELITQTREEAEQARRDRVSAEQTMNNEIASALRKAESAQTSADGKSTIYYGTATPKSPKAGDTWFKQGTGGSQILQFVGGKWVQHTDFAQLDKDLADNKKAVEAAARDVAAAQAKVKQLTEVELPAISEGTAEFNKKLKAETDARERELAAANAALTNAKADLATSMGQLETRLKQADTQLKTAMDNKVRDDLAAAKRDLGQSMSQLETRLKDADKLLEARVGKAATKQLEDAKVDLEKSLKANADALDTARGELSKLGYSRPGNIFPDPFFGHPVWGDRRQFPGLKIVADGTLTGKYFANDRTDAETGVQLEPGASYLMTVDAAFYGDVNSLRLMLTGAYSDGSGNYYSTVGEFQKQGSGAHVDTLIFTVPHEITSGSMTLGFYISSQFTRGHVLVDNVRLVRAADNSLVVDGAITAAKVQAGAIDTGHLAADAVTADKIKAGEIVAGKLASNSVSALNLQADSVTARSIMSNQILTKHIKAGQVTASEIASNTITAKQIAAGTITANELGAGSVTAKQILANSITGDHIAARSIAAEQLHIAPGNLFPDPEFRDPCWNAGSVKTSSQYGRNVLVLNASGASTGLYYTPGGEVSAVRLEPGSAYRMSCWARFGGSGGAHSVFVYVRYEKADGSTGYFPAAELNREQRNTYGSGGPAEVMFTTPDDMASTQCTIGFFLPGKWSSGEIMLGDVQIVRAADANLIVDGAVVADKLAANAVTAQSIASNEILTRHIKSNQITTNELAANAVRANNIAAGQITADKIGANQITGKHVLANSITANELQIRPGNLFPDPEFRDPCWNVGRVRTQESYGRNTLYLEAANDSTGTYYYPSGQIYALRLEPDSAYKMTCWTRFGGSGRTDDFVVYIKYPKADGGTGYYQAAEVTKNTNTSFGQGGVSSVVFSTPNDMATSECTIGFFIPGKYDSGVVQIADVHLTRAADASLIVDGAILAHHIKAGEITADQIASDTITSTNMKADSITGREVKSGTINADQLKVNNGWIKNAMIGNAEIDSSKIKSIDAGTITTGTMSGKRIDADSITVRQLRANSIIPIGGSLIPHEPPPSDDTKPPEPIWWQACNSELGEDYGGAGSLWQRPEGNPWRTSPSATNKRANVLVPKRLVKVKPGQKYKLKVWLRATVANTKMFIELRDQNGKLPRIYNAPHTSNYATKWYNDSQNRWDVADFDQSFEGGKVDADKARQSAYLLDNYTVHTYPTLVTATVWFGPETEYVYLNQFYFNHSNGSAQGNQWIAGLSLELDIPDQAEVDRLQDENAKRIEDGVKLNTKFSEQQRKVNRMVQNQQWVHQDMIELLDIRTPKLYGWPSGYSMEGKKTTCPYNNRSGHRIATPFYEQWECGSGKSSEVIVAARGQWTGWMHVSINWDSGVIDDWAVEITPTDRIGSFTGGAYHIDIRSISVEVYPRSLNRKATIILFNDPPQDVWQKMFPGNLSGDDSRPRKKWDSYGDDNRLFRHMLKKRIRLKNTVTCDRNVWVRDEEGNRQQIRAGNNIYAAEIYPEDQDYANGTKFTFTEVDDPVRMDEADRFGYEVGKERPSGTPTNYESRVK